MLIRKISWRCQESLKRILRKFNIEVARHYPDRSDYMMCHPYAYKTYTPWREQQFLKIYNKIANRTTVREERGYMLAQFAQHCWNLQGDFAECGVYQGGSAYLISMILEKGLGSNGKSQERYLHLFDTFKGMPDYVNDDPSGHQIGDFGDVSIDDIEKFLSPFSFIKYHHGVIPQTFYSVEDRKFVFVHVDVDLYKSVYESCVFFYSRLSPGGIMIFDDYGFEQYEHSARKAVDDYFADKPESPTTLRTGQCFVIKL